MINAINLVANPATDQPPIRLLLPSETFQTIEPKEQDAFVHARMAKGDQGWVLKDGVSMYSRKDWMAEWADADNDCQDKAYGNSRTNCTYMDSRISLRFLG